MTTSSPSWTLSRYVRTAIICSDLPVTADTVTSERIQQIAANLTGNGHHEIAGYNASTVRMILLDVSVQSPYPTEAPKKYAGK